VVANKYAKYVQPTPAPQPEQQPAPASQNKYRKYLQPVPEPAAPSANAANPIVTAQRQSQTQAMSQWAAQQEARKAAEAADAARRQQERREASRVNMGDFIVDENAAPIQTDYEKDIGKGVAGAPLSFGQGLAEGGANLINNVTNIGAEGLNAANRLLLGDKAYQFTGTNIEVPRNVLIGEGAPLESVTGALPRGVGQMMAVRMPLGKLKPGGGLPGMAIKDAAAFAATTDKDTPRLVDMLPAGTPIASALQSRDGEGYTEAFLKNAAEDLTMSGASAGVMKLVETALGAGGQAGRQAARAPEPEPTPAPAPQAPAPTVQPFSAPAEPSGGSFIRNFGTRAIGGGIGATLGGVGDAIAAEGDGSRGGPDIINPVTGAAAGIFGPSVVARGLRVAARPFRPAGFDERVAARAVRKALLSGGIKSEQDALNAARARFGDKPASVADLTQEGVGISAGISRLPGATGDVARARSEDLISNRAGRLERDIGEATGANPATISGDVDRMIALAQEQATPAYDALRAQYPFGSLTSPRLKELRELDILKPHIKGVERYQDTLAKTENRVVGDFEFWDLVKRSLDDTEQAAIARNQPVPYDLDSARQAIVKEMDARVPGYAEARQLGGEAPKMQAAFRQGQGLLGGRYTAEDVSRLVQAVTGQPLTALQAGVIRSMVGKTEGAGAAIAALSSAGAQRKLEKVFGKGPAEAMRARFKADAALVQNASRINPNVGSVTSQAEMSQGGILPAAADLMRTVRSPVESALAAMSRSGSYTKAQRDLMGEMLLGGADPDNLARIFAGKKPKGGGRASPSPVPSTGLGTVSSAPRRPEQSGFGGGRKLPMDEASRMSRAREMGFDVDTPLYHGTNKNIEEFAVGANRDGASGSREGPLGVWLTNSPDTASSFADWAGRGQGGENVMPVFARLKNPLVVDSYAAVKDVIDKYTKFERPGYEIGGRQIRMVGDKPDYAAARKAMEAEGYDGIIIRNTMTDSVDGNPIDQVLVFDPANIRGKFAKFDPSESSSSKLLAGTGANATGLGGAGGAVAGAAYGEFGPLQDMDRDGDTDAEDRQAMRMSYGFGGLVGGGLAGAGANRLLGPRRGVSKAGPQKPPAQAPQAKAAPAVDPNDPFGDKAWLAQKKMGAGKAPVVEPVDTSTWVPEDFQAARTQLGQLLRERRTAPPDQWLDYDTEIAQLKQALEQDAAKPKR
jgi:hypothetical protein